MSDTYEFIDAEYATCRTAPSVTRMCDWLEVSKSGFYEWRSRPQSATARRREELALLLDVANRIEGHTICAFGDAAAWPVQSFLKHYRHEFEYMIDHRGRSLVSETLGARAA